MKRGHETFFSEAPESQRKLMESLLGAPLGATDEQLREWLGFASNLPLRGLLIGLFRRAKNAGLEPPILKTVTRTRGGRGRAYRYRLSPPYLRALHVHQEAV